MIMNYQIPLKAKKKKSLLLSGSQGGVHNLASWFYSENYPITCLDRPFQLQETGVLRFLDNRHMKVIKMSALHTGRLYPSCQNIPLALISVSG